MTQRKAPFALLIGLLSLLLMPGAAVSGSAPEIPEGSFFSLCYHNVEDNDPDQSYDGVSTSRLIEQLAWLKHEGYHPISVDDLIAAKSGKRPLPPKALLLTFDDGYESFYSRVYPVLRAFHFPAVIAVVDEWMEGKVSSKQRPGDSVHYGDKTMSRDAFLTWAQLREMQKSGLIEIASHSDRLHYGVPANPQGNTQPAAITSIYNPENDSYESAQHYRARLEEDAEASVRKITKETGHRPRVMVWPYGAYNKTGIDIEAKNGMHITLSLDDGLAKVNSLESVPRFLVKDDPNLSTFAVNIRQAVKINPIRVMQIDLDYVYDDNKQQMSRNIDALINRVHAMHINTVFLQAFADPKGTGLASQVYFPNEVLPMRANLFNHVAWQLNTRTDVKVYGWLPVSSFALDDSVPRVTAFNAKTGQAAPDTNAYKRISIFDKEGREQILQIYADMASHAPIDGLLFHDDAMLSDFEDASPSALAAYREAGLPGSIATIRADKGLMKRWTEFKTDALIDFTHEITDTVKEYREPIKTVRNIYAPLLLKPESEAWFAQNYPRFLEEYDYTAVEAMPRMENVSSGDADDWLNQLVDVAQKQPNGLQKTIFELQSVDWRSQHRGEKRAIPTSELAGQMRLLTHRGALNFGYYPDDFVTNTPNAEELHKDFSLQTYSYRP